MTLRRAPGVPLHVHWQGELSRTGDVLTGEDGRVHYRVKMVVEIAPSALTLPVSRHASPRHGPGGRVHRGRGRFAQRRLRPPYAPVRTRL